MKVISLFSGAGGLDLGLIQAGMKVVWANDIDSDSVETYKHNIGNHIELGDIVDIKSSEIPDADIVVGGFPCQGFSNANRFRNSKDVRNVLYAQMLRIIRDKKPKWFLAENVRGILSLDGGKAFRQIIEDFHSIGYRIQHQVVNMADYGVPQVRQRVIILGTRNDLPENMTAFHPRTTHAKNCNDSGLLPWNPISKPLDEISRLAQKGVNLPNMEGSSYKLAYRNFTGHRETAFDKPSPTVLARGNGGGGVCAIPHPNGKRRLNVRESAAVQSFPLKFKFLGSLNSQYRQVGNAIPVLFGKAIGDMFLGLGEPTMSPSSGGTKPRHGFRVLSLFCGAGGMDLGFKKAGHDIVWANDNDTIACETYQDNIGNHIVCRDVLDVKDDELPKADIVIGGFPCQGFSHANTKRTADDSRNQLYKQFLRVLNTVKPAYFVAENVKGILSLDGGAVFKNILNDFSSCGYDCKYKVLNAADYGTPQIRERVIILGVRHGQKEIASFPIPTHSREGSASTKPWVTVKQALSELPSPDAKMDIPNHSSYSKFKLKFNGYIGNRRINPDKPAPTVTARGDRRGGVVVLHHYSNRRRMTPRELATIQGFPFNFKFHGNQSDAYRQIGNAVPPPLAFAIAQIFNFSPSKASPSNKKQRTAVLA